MIRQIIRNLFSTHHLFDWHLLEINWSPTYNNFRDKLGVGSQSHIC
jgi:hypothetical protein